MPGANRLLMAGIMLTITVLLGLSACTSDDPARDDGPTPTAEPTGPSTPDDTPAPDDTAVPKKYAKLLARARAEGEVPVIVSLKLDSTPAADRARQRAIAEAIQDMYDQLERFDFQEGHTFKLYPMFAARVDEAVLRYLIESSDVKNVSEDALNKPE